MTNSIEKADQISINQAVKILGYRKMPVYKLCWNGKIEAIKTGSWIISRKSVLNYKNFRDGTFGIEEVARELEISNMTVSNLCSSGRLTAQKIRGEWRIQAGFRKEYQEYQEYLADKKKGKRNSAREAAKILGCTRANVSLLCISGKVKAKKIDGCHWEIDMESVEQFKSKRKER